MTASSDDEKQNKRKKRYNFSKRRARFKREDRRSDSSISSEDVQPTRQNRRIFRPPSPPRSMIRSSRRTKDRPTCLLFGIHREELYPDYFFCSNCKLYEDTINCGAAHGLLKRNSNRYKCMASHADFFFPTQLKYLDLENRAEANRSVRKTRQPELRPILDVDDATVEDESNSVVAEVSNEDALLQDFLTLQAAFEGCQEKIRGHAESQEAMLERLRLEHAEHVEALKLEFVNCLGSELLAIASYVDELKGTINELNRKMHSLQTQVSFYQRKALATKGEQLPSMPLKDAIIQTINNLVQSKQRYKLLSNSNKASAVAKAIFDPALLDGIAINDVMNECKQWLRQNVFQPAAILKQMDLKGGTLNYEGIKVLNDVETAGYTGEKRRVRNRLICTPACLKRVAKVLENEGNELCPFSHISTEFGEGIEFDYAKVTRLVINAFNLESAAKDRNVNLSMSIDAAKVTKNICHTSAGLKVTDVQGRDPLKGMRSFISDQNSLHDLQSQNNIFLMKIILTRETKESFKLFDDLFQFFRLTTKREEERISDEKNLDKYQWVYLNDLQPLSVTCTTDMAAEWKLAGVGGGCKNTEMFCTLCACSSDDVHLPNEKRCSRFCEDNDDDCFCYHHPIMCTETAQEELLQGVDELRQLISADLDEIDRNSKIRYYPNSSANAAKTNINSIYFEPSNEDEQDEFVDLLMDELILRGLCPSGELQELRERLLHEVVLEHKLRQHWKKLKHCSKLESALIALLHKIPDILHCENRVGIKLLTMLLKEGFSNVQKGFLFGYIRSERERLERYAKEIENILNTIVLGDEDGPAQWCLPYDKDNKTVGVICLDNNRIRRILVEFEILIRASVTDEARAEKYSNGIENYRHALTILRQREEYTDEQIVLYQRYVDAWFRNWIALWSKEGCTNYTHLLSSAHMAEYMHKWRNLYRFSQQGWEKFNHVFTTYYFRRTNHGGRRHADAIKSKLMGVARWLQRRLLWMTGYGDRIIYEHNINQNNDNGNNSSDDE